MFNRHDISRNYCQLFGGQARLGYDWWWHSFTGRDAETGEEKPFFIEFFLCNPASGKKEPVFGQLPENQAKGVRPSYLMVKAGAWGEDAAQLHRFWGWKCIEVQMRGPLGIKADDCSLSETFTRGSIEVSLNDSCDHPEWMCQAGKMSWELSIGKKTAFNVGWGASRPMRALQLFEMFWHVEQRTWLSRMVTDVTCEKKEMLLVNYEAPNGERRHRKLWNGGNGHGTVSLYHCGKLIDRIKAENIGCEYGEYDTEERYSRI